jgi:hypothetical protein
MSKTVEKRQTEKEAFMPRFLIQATFSQEAAKRLIEDGGTKRAAAVKNFSNSTKHVWRTCILAHRTMGLMRSA